MDSLKLIYPNAEPIVVEGFKECNFGKWEGKSAKDLEHDPDFIQWMESGSTMSPRPEGKMEATLCSASVWNLKHLWNV